MYMFIHWWNGQMMQVPEHKVYSVTNDSESGLVYYEHDQTEKMQMKSLRTHFVQD